MRERDRQVPWLRVWRSGGGDPDHWPGARQRYRAAGLNPIHYESAGKRRDSSISREGRVDLPRALIDLGGPGMIVPNNMHVATTRANVECSGAEALDLVIAEGRDPQAVHPFKGNMEIDALDRLLRERGDDVPVVLVTVTNNSDGGQPVSLESLHAVRRVCERYGKPLFLDACRFAKNGWFARQHEPGQADRDVSGIVREVAGLADGMTMSAKKDPMGTSAAGSP